MAKNKVSIHCLDSDLEHIIFKPTKEQEIVKAQFWSIVRESANIDVTAISVNGMCRIAGGKKLEKWLAVSEFRAWFLNENHAKYKIQAAAELAIDTLTDVMMSEDSRLTGSKIKAAELILKYAGYEIPKVSRVEISDKEVNEMDSEELKAFIDKSMKRIGFTKEGDNENNT